jgi:hypothetical protein
MSACTDQAALQPASSLLGRAYAVEKTCISRVWPFKLDGVSNGSSLALTLQPSLAPHRDTTSRITPTPSRESAYPLEWLHCQSAWHRIVTNPAQLSGFPVAEHRVESRCYVVVDENRLPSSEPCEAGTPIRAAG